MSPNSSTIIYFLFSREVIDSHDGWGQKPVRQDTAWELETTPKSKRKFPAAGPTIPEKPAAATAFTGSLSP
jgi:hypothetical protein